MKKNLLFAFALLLSFGLASAQAPVKKVVVEEFTGAWCGWCPDGAVILEDIVDKYPNAIGVSVHDGDQMVTANGNYVISFYASFFPSGVVDRQSAGLSRTEWETETQAALNTTTPVGVSIEGVTYDAQTRVIEATVRAKWASDHSGKHRINLLVVEDSVTGTGTGYDQANYLNGQTGHPYAGAGNPIIGYKHRHVLREYLGGSWGTYNVIPNTVVAGDEHTRTYTYTLPPDRNPDRITLVGIVSLFNGGLTNQRPILNAEEVSLLNATSVDPDLDSEVRLMEVYPNPFYDRINIEFDLQHTGNIRMEVINPLGQSVYTIAEGMMPQGGHTLYWDGRDAAGGDAKNGVYFIRLTTESGQAFTKMVMLAR